MSNSPKPDGIDRHVSSTGVVPVDDASPRSSSVFSGYRFPDDVIALAVRWYLRYRLPYADLAELLAERGVHVDPSTIFGWVQQFTPLYQEAARPHRRRVGQQWSIDETYTRIAGRWCYAFRAIAEDGQVIDVYVIPHATPLQPSRA